ncbi:MAG TPA: type VI secretion system tube protein Hcp [Actinomycetota bacterium]
MAVDMFLKVDGIPGESLDSKHKGEIDILSFSWGASRATDPTGGAVGLHDFSFGHRLDFASPQLMLACASGKHIPTALLTVRKSTQKAPVEYMKVTLSDCLVSSFQSGGHGEALPTESFSLNFAKVKIFYEKVRLDGSVGESETVEFLNPDRNPAG